MTWASDRMGGGRRHTDKRRLGQRDYNKSTEAKSYRLQLGSHERWRQWQKNAKVGGKAGIHWRLW